jgi:hypothetical protein
MVEDKNNFSADIDKQISKQINPRTSGPSIKRKVLTMESTPKSLAVVIPFTSNDFNQLLASIKNWDRYGEICPFIKQNTLKSVSLYFMFNRNITTFMSEERQQKLNNLIMPFKNCFNDIGYLSANLSGYEDIYPYGPSNMWYQLFLGKSEIEGSSYDYLFWMEHDVHPIRGGWLDFLLLEISFNGDFFVKGSLHRGRWLDAVETNFDSMQPWVAHINGNALYAFNDEVFRALVSKANSFFDIKLGYLNSFDVSLWMHSVTNIASNWKNYQTYAHKFQYSDYIISIGKPMDNNPENATTIRQIYPKTYFVHGTIIIS